MMTKRNKINGDLLLEDTLVNILDSGMTPHGVVSWVYIIQWAGTWYHTSTEHWIFLTDLLSINIRKKELKMLVKILLALAIIGKLKDNEKGKFEDFFRLYTGISNKIWRRLWSKEVFLRPVQLKIYITGLLHDHLPQVQKHNNFSF